MKKIIGLGLILCLTGCVCDKSDTTAIQQNASTPEVTSVSKINKNATPEQVRSFFAKRIKELKLELDDYQKKSDAAKQYNDFELDAIYTKLASGIGKMVEGFTGIEKATEMCNSIYSKNQNIMKEAWSQNKDSSVFMEQKPDLKTYSESVKMKIKKCEDLSAEADEKGQVAKAELYGDMESALTDKIKAIELYSIGNTEFNQTYDDLKNYRLESPKTITKKDNLKPKDIASDPVESENSAIKQPVEVNSTDTNLQNLSDAAESESSSIKQPVEVNNTDTSQNLSDAAESESSSIKQPVEVNNTDTNTQSNPFENSSE